MKKSKLVALIILLILIPMIAVITYFSPISKASSFVYQYGVTNGGPPFVTNIDGKQTQKCIVHKLEDHFGHLGDLHSKVQKHVICQQGLHMHSDNVVL